MNTETLKVALRTKFDESQLDTLLLANETNDVDIAIGMLLGLYVPPVIP